MSKTAISKLLQIMQQFGFATFTSHVNNMNTVHNFRKYFHKIKRSQNTKENDFRVDLMLHIVSSNAHLLSMFTSNGSGKNSKIPIYDCHLRFTFRDYS
jgi:hypothetical protein